MKLMPVCYRLIGAVWNSRLRLPQTDRGDTATTTASLEGNRLALARHREMLY